MILEGFNRFECAEQESGALRNILDYEGVVAPHTGEPFTEAMLMGIGGGISVEYAIWRWKSGRTQLALRLKHTKNYTRKDPQPFIHKAALRVGAMLNTHQTSSRKKAYMTLVGSLEEGKPVITYLSIWEDLRMRPALNKRLDRLVSLLGPPMDSEFVHFLPYYTLPYRWISRNCVVVYGIDEDVGQAHIADWNSQPLSISLEELAESRAAIPGRRHAAYTIDPPRDVGDLKKAIRAGIRDCFDDLMSPSLASARMGVQAIEGWANLVANQKNKMGWPQAFSNEELFDALTKVHAVIEFFNTSGGAHRSTYADFLEEGSDIINKPELRYVSSFYRDLARKWTDLANMALPDSVPLFKNARLAALKWNDIFLKKGQAAPRQLEKATEEVKSIRDQVVESFPLTESETLELLGDLSTHLLKIYAGEKEAAAALKSVI